MSAYCGAVWAIVFVKVLHLFLGGGALALHSPVN